MLAECPLQKSEFVISLILQTLLERGIVAGRLQLKHIYEEDDATELQAYFEQCFQWLKSEGLVRFSNISMHSWKDGGPAVVNSALTSKGFNLLGSRLEFGQSGIPLGKAVAEVAAGQRSYSNLGDFFGGLLGGFTKSVNT